MADEIRLPALAPNMESALLARWLKKVGDTIAPGDVLAEIETDKATMEIEAETGGTLAEILVAEGSADVPVDTVIGRLAGQGEAGTAVRPDLPGSSAAASFVAAASAGGRRFASPLARRLARERGLDLASITGSGPAGRIMKQDIAAAPAAATAPALPSPAAGPSAPAAAPAPATGAFEDSPHDAMRLAVAGRLSSAKQTIPHFYLTVSCALDRLLAMRGEVNAALDGSGVRTSINDWLVKALATALVEVPDANVGWTETALRRFASADIAIAVALPGGLITPILRNAERKSISAISREAGELVERARARKLRPEEYQGGTASLSNLGMYGVESFCAILNPPQALILAVGAAEERIVARGGEPCVATMMSCTLSVDHRAIDGAVAARLLASFRRLVENPLALIA